MWMSYFTRADGQVNTYCHVTRIVMSHVWIHMCEMTVFMEPCRTCECIRVPCLWLRHSSSKNSRDSRRLCRWVRVCDVLDRHACRVISSHLIQTSLCTWHDAMIRETWHLHTCDMAQEMTCVTVCLGFVAHEQASSLYMTWLIGMCRDVETEIRQLIRTFVSAWHDFVTGVTWRAHIWHDCIHISYQLFVYVTLTDLMHISPYARRNSIRLVLVVWYDVIICVIWWVVCMQVHVRDLGM